MSEYSPLPGTARSKLVRAELEEPCTRNSTGNDGSPAFGAPTRLRHRLSLTSPFSPAFSAQYSPFQIAASLVAAEVSAAPTGKASPTPAPSVAALRSVRRAIAGMDGVEPWFMGFSSSAARQKVCMLLCDAASHRAAGPALARAHEFCYRLRRFYFRHLD